jgi:hypothetical protein
MLFGDGALKAAPPGFVEGRVIILALKESRGAQLAEGGFSKAPAEGYDKYPLVVLTLDGRTEVARTTASDDGSYRFALPPGAYTLDVKDRADRELKVKPQQFTVESNQTVRVDMLISK